MGENRGKYYANTAKTRPKTQTHGNLEDSTQVVEPWRKLNTGPKKVVGEKDPFTDKAIKEFARGAISRTELMFRLKYGHESRGRAG